MSVLLFCALALFANTIADRYWLLRCGEPGLRLDNLPNRLRTLLAVGFGQRRLLFETTAGWMHIGIFVGFLVVSLRTVTTIGRGFVADFNLPFFSGPLGQIYAVIKDLFVIVVLCSLAVALWRRLVLRPARLHFSIEACMILLWIALLMLSDLFGDAALFVLQPENHERGYAFLSTALCSVFASADHSAVESWYGALFWAHSFLVLAFLNYLPYGKHFHVLTALPATFLARLNSPAALERMDFEGKESFGVGTIDEFSWRRILDMYTCTECGRCQANCPAAVTDKPLSPRTVVCNERDHAYALADKLVPVGKLKAAGHMSAATAAIEQITRPALIGDIVDEEAIWACTTCGYCVAHCPVMIDHIPNIVDMRRYLTMTQAKVPTALQTALRGLETNSNPWNTASAAREDWIDDLDVPRMRDKGSAEFLLFVGCAGSFDDRNNNVIRALCKLLNAAAVDYAVLGTEEGCCGDPTRRVGNEYLFQMQAEQNISNFKRYKVQKIITACPHGFSVIKNEYPDFGLDGVEVFHHSQILVELIQQGRLKVSTGEPSTITFHDSCYLGRHNDVYKAPRQVLGAVSGLEIKEMERSGQAGFCCGAGGGRMFMEEDIGQRINHNRIDEVATMGATQVASACPFCLTMLDDAIKETEREQQLKALDIAEILAAHLDA